MDLTLMGSKIKAERKRLNLTLETLSEQIGISRNYLWEIEAGRKAPALNTLFNLGVTLNVSIDYLLGASAEKKSISGNSPATERDLEIARIMKALNEYEVKELSLISNVIQPRLLFTMRKILPPPARLYNLRRVRRFRPRPP